MRRKNYWKELCLLLIGIILGYLISPSRPYKTISNTITQRDTIVIRDTILSKTIVPPLNRENVEKELIRRNIPCYNIVLAQSILETGEYTSSLCKTHNNIFGIKKGNKYKYYTNWKECISDYSKYFSSKYKGGDYYEFLIKCNYAEDIEYINKLKKIV